MSPTGMEAAPARLAPAAPCELAIIAPTFNERENVGELIKLLDAALQGRAWEIVFVDDDSTDGTPEALINIARADPRVRVIRRIGRRGLSTAVVEGVLATSAPIVAVMDADLQHDERILPDMIARIEQGDCDLVVGSRYVDGGGVGDWSAQRQSFSRFATKLAKLVVKADLTDPMSGFFVIRREAFEGAVRRLSGQGFKVLLDVLASSPAKLRVAEAPYTFRNRIHGESKLDSAVLWDYAALLLDKTIGRFVPVRFVMFILVGGLGVFVHFGVLTLLFQGLGQSFLAGQTAAAIVAMTFNFFVNNALTYRDKRLRGAGALLRGLLTFYAVCSIGLIANIGIANFLFEEAYGWWLSGVAGILVGAVWNYAASAVFTWKR
ncbi:MAG TPA: glycosyltransferase family 2 protein [Terricaulis sp.]|nr:glycosyltransferase family 2 protein [Terricaulis sp.]